MWTGWHNIQIYKFLLLLKWSVRSVCFLCVFVCAHVYMCTFHQKRQTSHQESMQSAVTASLKIWRQSSCYKNNLAGTWLSVASVVTVSQKEKSAGVFYKHRVHSSEDIPPTALDSPHTQLTTVYSSTQTSEEWSYNVAWFSILVVLFSVVLLLRSGVFTTWWEKLLSHQLRHILK